MGRPTVLLFDIDGTLLTMAGVGRRALERAFSERYGPGTSLAGVRFDGMTDRGIVRDALALLGAPAAEETIDAILASYVSLLEGEVASTPGLGLHRGVLAALDAAATWPGVAIGLGTGNIREGARVKLRHVGIHDRFAFGGFGCDHEERAELLRIGADRGRACLGLPPGPCRVVVIGDTPRDVEGARAIGAESMAVATGRFARAELEAAGATFVFDHLETTGVHQALRGE
jgi:phosphoglycolate phosphatase-like HAD superfamily hydrolase